MTPSTDNGPTKTSGKRDVHALLAELKRRGTKATRDGMARYAIPSDKAFGVTVGTLKQIAKPIGRDHELALELWEAGWYELKSAAVTRRFALNNR